MPAKPKIILAPMEGVVDALMRDMLTKIGGFDYRTCESKNEQDDDTSNND